MMYTVTKVSVAIAALLLWCIVCITRTNAFTQVAVSTSQPKLRVQQQQEQPYILISTTDRQTTTVLFAGSRRAIFHRTKKAFVGTVASIGLLRFLPTSVASAATSTSASSTTSTTTLVADASSTVTLLDNTVTAQPTGRIVEFTVQNLDGEIGKNGVVKIQLEPTWAPKGVKRFEVCNEEAIAFVYFLLKTIQSKSELLTIQHYLLQFSIFFTL
jgi:hypothetical protein